MKKYLIIFAHPNPESLNGALYATCKRILDDKGAQYQVIDLYKEQFNPILDHELKERVVYEDILAYQEKMKWADTYIFISPTWWYGEPAMLKGFFDRVLTARFAFQYGKIFGITYPIRLLKGKKALFIKTMNSPWWWYWFGMENWMIRNVIRGTLGFCGIKVKPIRLYGIVFKEREEIERYIQKIEKKLRKLLT